MAEEPLTVREVGVNSDDPADADWMPYDELKGYGVDWDDIHPDFRRVRPLGLSENGESGQ